MCMQVDWVVINKYFKFQLNKICFYTFSCTFVCWCQTPRFPHFPHRLSSHHRRALSQWNLIEVFPYKIPIRKYRNEIDSLSEEFKITLISKY